MASSEYGHQASFSLREKVIAEQSDEGLTVTMRISSAISGNTYPLLAIRYSLSPVRYSPFAKSLPQLRNHADARLFGEFVLDCEPQFLAPAAHFLDRMTPRILRREPVEIDVVHFIQ